MGMMIDGNKDIEIKPRLGRHPTHNIILVTHSLNDNTFHYATLLSPEMEERYVEQRLIEITS